MRERIETLTGIYDGFPWMGTFHSIGAKILRRHAELVGLKPNFTILDTDDQIRLLKQILKAENIDDKRWPARALAGQIDALEEPRPRSRACPRRRSRRLRQRQGRRALQGLSGAAEDAQRRRLRRPAAGEPRLFREHPDVLPNVSAAPALHPGRRIPGHQRRPISLAAPARPGASQRLLRRRRRSVDLRLARRRSRQHPAFRARFSRRQGDPARAQLPLDRTYPRRRFRAHRPQPQSARQDAVHRRGDGGEARVAGVWDSAEEARASATRSRRRSAQGVSLADIAILVRASFQMREFEERFLEIGRALSRHRRPAVL